MLFTWPTASPITTKPIRDPGSDLTTSTSLRLLDAARDELLALMAVLAVALLASLVIAVSTLGAFDPSSPGSGAPSPSAQAAPLAPHE